MLTVVSGLAGILITAAVAIYLRAREEKARRAEREESDVWRAIDSLRESHASSERELAGELGKLRSEFAEWRGLVTGLFREVLDDPEVWRPAPRREREP